MTYQPQVYNLSFTAGSLRPDLARVVASAFIETGSWEKAKKMVMDGNLLQYDSVGSAKRMEQEIRSRLMTLTKDQLTYMAQASIDEATSIAWLAACKRILFVHDFAVDVLREKLAHQDNVLRHSDYEHYLTLKRGEHLELNKLTDLSKSKTRQVMYKMLAEAGITDASPGQDDPILHRPPLSYAVTELIVNDDRKWLRAFLIPDHELSSH
jgi:Putative inner membrane protein (DUF1819)